MQNAKTQSSYYLCVFAFMDSIRNYADFFICEICVICGLHYTNFILLAAKATILNNNMPCFQREIFVEP